MALRGGGYCDSPGPIRVGRVQLEAVWLSLFHAPQRHRQGLKVNAVPGSCIPRYLVGATPMGHGFLCASVALQTRVSVLSENPDSTQPVKVKFTLARVSYFYT